MVHERKPESNYWRHGAFGACMQVTTASLERRNEVRTDIAAVLEAHKAQSTARCVFVTRTCAATRGTHSAYHIMTQPPTNVIVGAALSKL